MPDTLHQRPSHARLGLQRLPLILNIHVIIQNRTPNNINRKLHRKVTKLESTFRLSCVSGCEQSGPGAPLLGLAKSIYHILNFQSTMKLL